MWQPTAGHRHAAGLKGPPTLTGAFPTTAVWRKWQEYLDRLEVQLLPMAQEAAIGALTGALGIVSVVQGRRSISDLSAAAQWLIGGLVILATLLAVWAIYLGTDAARGAPNLDIRLITGVAQGRSVVLREKDKALALLNKSRRVAAGALAAVVVAVGLSWSLPRDADERSTPVVVRTDQQIVCGIVQDARKGLLRLKQATGGFVEVPAAAVTQLVPVQHC